MFIDILRIKNKHLVVTGTKGYKRNDASFSIPDLLTSFYLFMILVKYF